MAPIHMLCRPEDFAREEHDRAETMLLAALAEAGYPISPSRWNGRYYVNDDEDGIPEDVLLKAQRLVADHLGWPYAGGAA